MSPRYNFGGYNFEGVQNNPHIGLLLINVIAVFILYLIASLIILEKQEV
jgi:hypothetical protein